MRECTISPLSQALGLPCLKSQQRATSNTEKRERPRIDLRRMCISHDARDTPYPDKYPAPKCERADYYRSSCILADPRLQVVLDPSIAVPARSNRSANILQSIRNYEQLTIARCTVILRGLQFLCHITRHSLTCYDTMIVIKREKESKKTNRIPVDFLLLM
jgi:hypothetical protein